MSVATSRIFLGNSAMTHVIERGKDKPSYFEQVKHVSQIIPATIQALTKPITANDKKNYHEAQVTNLVDLTDGAHKNLFSAKTASPFAMFRDTLKIDRQKLTIVHHDFFRTSQINSIRIKDMMNVHVRVGPLFGSIDITSKFFLNNMQTIKMLRRGDIMIAQRMLQGFMIAHQAKIDTDNIDDVQLLSLLNRLGQENL